MKIGRIIAKHELDMVLIIVIAEGKETAMTFQDLMDSFYINDDLCNTRVYNNLYEQMHRDRVVPVIGAGLSFWAHYPLWKNLLLQMSNGMPVNLQTKIEELIQNNQYEKAASIVEEFYHPNHFQDALRKKFSPKNLDKYTRPEYQNLIPLLFEGPIVTTNFDKSLEWIIKDHFVITPASDFLSEETNNRIQKHLPCIMKLHGSVDDPKHMILTEKSYNEVYGNNPDAPDLSLPLPNALHTVLQSAPPLFLGCGLGSDRTCAVMKSCCGATGFALLELPEETENVNDPLQPVLKNETGYIPALAERINFLDSLGLQVIWYPRGKHEEAVGNLLKQLAEDLNVSPPSLSTPENLDKPGKEEKTSSFPQSIRKERKAVPNDNKPKRKTLELVGIICTIIGIIVGIISIIVTINNLPQITENEDHNTINDSYHITVKMSGNSALQDYDKTIETIQKRLDIYSEGTTYKCVVNENHSMDIYLPEIMFSNDSIEEELRGYIFCKAKLYLVDMGNYSHWIPVDRKYLEHVDSGNSFIPNINVKDYGISDSKYSYLYLTLSDEFVKSYKDQYDDWSKLSFALDVEEYGTKYAFYTFPVGDSKSYYILNQKLSNGIYAELMAYSLNQPSLSENLEYKVDVQDLVQWEDTGNNIEFKGKHQCNYNDLSEETDIFELKTMYSWELAEKEASEIKKAIVQRLDALGEPYALGIKSDKEDIAFVVKTTPHHINDDVLTFLGKSSDIYLATKCCNCKINMERIIQKADDGNIILNMNNLSFYDTEGYQKIKEVSTIEKGPIYVFFGDYPVLQFDPDSINNKGIIQTEYCSIQGGKICKIDVTEDNKWYCEFIASLLSSNSSMKRTYIYQYIQRFNTTPNDGIRPPLMYAGQKELEAVVKSIDADAIVENLFIGEISIDIHIPAGDQYFVQSSSVISRILRQLYKGQYYFNKIYFYVYDEIEGWPAEFSATAKYKRIAQSIDAESTESAEELYAKGRYLDLIELQQYGSEDDWYTMWDMLRPTYNAPSNATSLLLSSNEDEAAGEYYDTSKYSNIIIFSGMFPQTTAHIKLLEDMRDRVDAYAGPGENYALIEKYKPDDQYGITAYFKENGWILVDIYSSGIEERMLYIKEEDFDVLSDKLPTYDPNGVMGIVTADSNPRYGPGRFYKYNKDYYVHKDTMVKVLFRESDYVYVEYMSNRGMVRMWLPKSRVSIQ